MCNRYWLIHRADYQRLLYDAALEAGAEVMLSSPIDSIDQRTPAVILKDGRKLESDLMIGADGIRSKTRLAVLPDGEILANDSPNCAHRATVPASAMLSDLQIAHLMTDINANCWIGHQHHIMAYPIRQGEMYNLVLSHPGKSCRWEMERTRRSGRDETALREFPSNRTSRVGARAELPEMETRGPTTPRELGQREWTRGIDRRCSARYGPLPSPRSRNSHRRRRRARGMPRSSR